jgi:hypothetical protein
VPVECSLGGIARAAGTDYLRTHKTSSVQRKALRAIAACRTSALGGRRQQCDRCRFEHILWHSCRNRHCPRCQGAARAEWLDARAAELLPVPYFHVVFTVPEELNRIALAAPALLYDILFRAAGQTLTEVAATRLRASIGALTVLHTWGQTLTLHPHIHCVVPGGGFALDRIAWRNVRKRTFFLPVRVLARRFRTLVCNALREAWDHGELSRSQLFEDRVALELFLARTCRQQWVTYSKPPFGGPRQVLKYLAAYTHRIAISDRRIVGFDHDGVRFLARDYRTATTGVIHLQTSEFLRRFLLHVVPHRFVRIRYYGFLANRHRKTSLDHARRLLRTNPPRLPEPKLPVDAPRCPSCREGVMVIVALVAPEVRYWNDS